MKKTWKNDILLILALLVLAGAGWAALRLTRHRGGEAVVTVDGAVYAVLPLGEDADCPVETAYGSNRVLVRDGRVQVASADCPDALCVRTGWVEYAGESIVCLPHKLVVTVRGGKPGVDAVAGG